MNRNGTKEERTVNAMTPEQLTALSDIDLRHEVTRVLEPGPWEHRCLCWTWSRALAWKSKDPCVKCEQAGVTRMGCPVPDAAEGSWADLAERLLHQIVFQRHYGRAILINTLSEHISITGDGILLFLHWLGMSPKERVIVCLLALQEEKT